MVINNKTEASEIAFESAIFYFHAIRNQVTSYKHFNFDFAYVKGP